jgi:hypothetical protein
MSLIGSHCDGSPRTLKTLATPLHEADVNTHWLVNDALEKRKSVIKTFVEDPSAWLVKVLCLSSGK